MSQIPVKGDRDTRWFRTSHKSGLRVGRCCMVHKRCRVHKRRCCWCSWHWARNCSIRRFNRSWRSERWTDIMMVLMSTQWLICRRGREASSVLVRGPESSLRVAVFASAIILNITCFILWKGNGWSRWSRCQRAVRGSCRTDWIFFWRHSHCCFVAFYWERKIVNFFALLCFCSYS